MIISRFTPSSMKPETLEAIFVQRHELVKDLIEVIRDSALTNNKHFRLLIGGRGMGKTHTISLIYHRLSAMDDLKDKLAIAWMVEEEWGISSFLDLLLRIFRAFNLQKEYQEEYQAKLEQEIQSISQMSPDIAEHKAGQLLREFIGGRTLLLLMENLDDIFSGLGDIGQKQFRAYIQNYSFITILATSQRLLNGVKQKNAAFYGFFYPQRLEKLELDEVIDLLKRIAKVQGNQELESFIQSPIGRDRISAIHHLAGGNHRVYVIFAEFLTRQSLDDLIEPFMQTLDELTPYYQARMQWLSPQQRKIIDFLCDRHRPVTVKEIAQYCFITHQTASSQLKDLREKGYVQVEAIGRESFYDLQEVLMRYCLNVKKQRGEPISLFVDFLRCWYTKDELQERWKKLNEIFHGIRFDSTSIKFSDYFLISEVNYSHVLEREYISIALQQKEEEEKDLRIAAYFQEGSALVKLGQYEEAIVNFDRALEINSQNDLNWLCRAATLAHLGKHEEAIISYDRSLEINPDSDLAWLSRGETLTELGRYEEAIISYDRSLEINPQFDSAWNNRGIALDNLGRYEEAIISYDRALEINPEDDLAWNNRGIALDNLGRYEEAIISYDRALEINPEDDLAWTIRGDAFYDLGKYKEAVTSYDRTLAINPEDGFAWTSRGLALINLDKNEEAATSFDRAIKINTKNYFSWFFRGLALLNLKKYEEAITSYDRTIQIKPDNYSAWYIRNWIFIKLEQYNKALESFDRAIQLNPKHSSSFFHRTICLLALNRWDEGIDSLKEGLDRLTDGKKPDSEDIELIVGNLFKNTQNQKLWKNRIETLLEIFDNYKFASVLGQGIVKTIPMLMPEMISDKAAQTWLEIWQELTENRNEFQIPLRLLNTAVRYKQTKGDRKVLLELAIEERSLLEPLIV
jgi:tetratricopeptide (TPR) repeat protein